MALVQGADGNFYGSADAGGANGAGTVFKVTREGTLTSLYSFCALSGCPDGENPQATLLQATNGKFYGTTHGGGAYGCGTVFEITRTGALTTLHSFEDPIDGCRPAGLIQAVNGNLYGVTVYGGLQGGTFFEITPTGKFTTLYSFCSLPNCADGENPETSLVQGTDGNFYGTTLSGGANFQGTVFRITATGALTTLYSFCSLALCFDGGYPDSLVQGSDGNFYGTTEEGGVHCVSTCGTVFEINRGVKLSTLYTFCDQPNCADGDSPMSLVQGSDGNFYGTTNGPGAFQAGTAFGITSTGTLSTLHTFCSADLCSDGAYPVGGLLQATDGLFYGTTEEGGASNDGTVFSLDMGLAPFVSFIRNPAKVGQQFGILGYGLSGASGVVFNGTSASFTAKSDTLLIATVPKGATTGYVTVITPSGTLTSNLPFRVIR